MARPSKADIADKERAQKMDWSDLGELWDRIKAGKTKGWRRGKALEHLFIRGFERSNSKVKVEYPYDVPLGGNPMEQIDGVVYLDSIPFLVECKDKRKVDNQPLAKLHSQLLRRPPTTMGCVVVRGEFTVPALIFADLLHPLRISLWAGIDIQKAIAEKDFYPVLRSKFEDLCMYGLTDNFRQYKLLAGGQR